MEYYFSRTNNALDSKLIAQINLAQHTIDIAIYCITRNEIVNALIAAKNRGVTIRIICDREQAASKYEFQDILNLKAAHIPIKTNLHSGLMHIKMSIIDQQVVALGSYNYTKSATLENDEILVVITDLTMAHDCTSHFENMWNDSKHYQIL